MRHVLLEKDALIVGDWSGELRYDVPPIDFTRGDHFLRTRMLFAGRLQIVGVKRLIYDNCVAAAAPGAHHRR